MLTQSITKFVQFSNQYPKNFIEQVFGADCIEIKHLFFRRSFIDFYLLLKPEDKQKLVEWVELNYEPKN